MKTNVIMTRQMGGFDVPQRTSDGYFDANSLWAQWTKLNPSKHTVKEFLGLDKTKEFVNELTSQSRLNGDADFQAVREVKSVMTKNGKTRGQIYVHPYLFIDFAMWINPKFKYQVIRFVYDELIKNRHIAGDNYNKLTAQVCKLTNVDYPKMAEGLNYIVFNKHYKGIRNDATMEQLQELHELEENLSFLISTGFVSDFPTLVDTMRKIFNDKYRKF